MSQPLIELKELTKYFDISKTAKLHAVDGITLNINKGENVRRGGRIRLRKVHLGTHRAAASRTDLRHDPL